ncbi:MAG: MotA/TolQ/ExbB proton channel family protein [Paracoccaceae bacterium]|nr:MAG: MotA/TolQ/ExbB proton channel family protein [Paracoccaceae bacterium]
MSPRTPHRSALKRCPTRWRCSIWRASSPAFWCWSSAGFPRARPAWCSSTCPTRPAPRSRASRSTGRWNAPRGRASRRSAATTRCCPRASARSSSTDPPRAAGGAGDAAMLMPDIAGLDAVTLTVFAALGLLSALGTTVSLYKIVQFAILGLGRNRLADGLLADWHAGRRDQALTAARRARGVLPRVLATVFSARTERPEDTPWVEEVGRQAALDELARIGRWMRGLEAAVQAAPMLGLLGTVIGMIEAFGRLAESTGGVDPAALAGGIWTALSTTAVGLAIALVFYAVAIWLEGRIDAERQSLERALSLAVHGRPQATG